MSRFWPQGVPITVTCDELATPLEFVWQGYRHPIATIIDRYRDDTRWWQRRIWRENFLLITETGLLVLIYHDVRAGEWRVQRQYD
jgi:hypothetical protein